MNSEKLVYDADDGGDTKIKQSYIQTFQYASANIREMDDLVNEIKNPTSTKLIFQSLPKHMRRRAMSHNPNRLPRKYHVKHKSQMAKAGNPNTSKRPSRKFRRKPSNLMKEYLRRQRKNVWLETHIWHAKRFHMISKWGYKLPFASCDKTYRACYRASAKHCLLQDISFHNCIELAGSLEVIRSGFDRLTSSKCGLGITAKTFVSGRREGFLNIYKKDQYPYQCLGKVSFIWKPSQENKRVVWLFVHPSFYRSVIKELVDVFELSSNNNEDSQEQNTRFNRVPEYSGKELHLRELKDTINRFRLTGPLAQAVLSKVLIPYKQEESTNWFQEHFKKDCFSIQNSFWEEIKDCNSPAELFSNMVLGLVVQDFRLQRPKKRTKAVPLEGKNPSFEALSCPPAELPETPIWNSKLRITITKEFISNHVLNVKRSQTLLVPGEPCMFEKNLQPIPILLIQRPGSQCSQLKRLGYSSGWDVLLPSGYGLSLWLSLIMWGCRPGGIRETHMVNKEFGSATFRPDTISGKQELSESSEALRQRYFRLPPNKRCNYSKFSIASPFKPSFNQLVKEWSGADNFYILRDIQLLRQMESNSVLPKKILDHHKNSLIEVCLQMKTRGNPKDLAVICIPTKADLKQNFKTRYSNNPVYTEPLKDDPFEEERKSLKNIHKRLLKRLRNQRVRVKRLKQRTSCERVKISPPKTSQLIKEQFEKMSDLWVPRNPSSIRNQCSREVFGYVTQSSFCLSEGRVTAVGYITPQGLNKIMTDKRNPEMLVLVRGSHTRHYRFAKFKVNIEV